MKTPAKTALIVLVCTIAAITRFSSAADEKSTENYVLKKRIETLEARLSSMEGRLAKLETNKTLPVVRGNVLTAPQTERHGKIWKEGEANGWPYYVIPLGGISDAVPVR